MAVVVETQYRLFGRVQGVGCRRTIAKYASEHDIRGYVKNEANGSVIVIAQGTKTTLADFRAWLSENPGFTRIDRIQTTSRAIKKRHTSFTIKKDKAFVPDQVQSFRNLLKSP